MEGENFQKSVMNIISLAIPSLMAIVLLELVNAEL
jgi:hypothetical protein